MGQKRMEIEEIPQIEKAVDPFSLYPFAQAAM